MLIKLETVNHITIKIDWNVLLVTVSSWRSSGPSLSSFFARPETIRSVTHSWCPERMIKTQRDQNTRPRWRSSREGDREDREASRSGDCCLETEERRSWQSSVLFPGGLAKRRSTSPNVPFCKIFPRYLFQFYVSFRSLNRFNFQRSGWERIQDGTWKDLPERQDWLSLWCRYYWL